jgi:hypothetical protein
MAAGMACEDMRTDEAFPDHGVPFPWLLLHQRTAVPRHPVAGHHVSVGACGQ